MPGPYEQIMGPQPDPYSAQIPEMVAARERLKFAPETGTEDQGMVQNYLQNMLYGQQPSLPQRAWDSAVDMFFPTNPLEMVPGVGAIKKTGKVVDLDAFRRTGKVSPYEDMVDQDPFKGSPGIKSVDDLPPTRMQQADIDHRKKVAREAAYEKLDNFGKLKKRYRESGNDDVVNKLNELETMGHNEPYVGQFQTNWGINHIKSGDKIPQPLPVKNVGDLQGHLGKEVPQGGADPFGWIEAKYGATKDALINNYDKPLTVSTRSDLIGHDDYMEALNPRLHKIEIHILGDHERAHSQLETGAPSLLRRMKAAQKLLDNGFNVTLVHDKFSNTNAGWNKLNESQWFANDDVKKFLKSGGKFKTNDAGEIDLNLVKKSGLD